MYKIIIYNSNIQKSRNSRPKAARKLQSHKGASNIRFFKNICTYNSIVSSQLLYSLLSVNFRFYVTDHFLLRRIFVQNGMTPSTIGALL